MGTEKCPFCGQEIDAAAKRCFFCGADLNEESVHKRLEQLHVQDVQAARKIHKPLLIKVIVIVIFAGIVVFYSTSDRKHMSDIDRPDKSSAVKLNANVAFPGAHFIISNNDPFDWKNIKMEIVLDSLEERFSLSSPIILSGEIYKVDASKFINNNGDRFNPDKMRPRKFRILCDTPAQRSGSFLTDLK